MMLAAAFMSSSNEGGRFLLGLFIAVLVIAAICYFADARRF